jgi:hypothetical protein
MHKLGCGSTAYSVGTVYGGKRHLYTPGVRPASVATPRRPTVDAQLAPWTTPCSPCQADTGTRPIFQQGPRGELVASSLKAILQVFKVLSSAIEARPAGTTRVHNVG